jgi:hypothetical protein
MYLKAIKALKYNLKDYLELLIKPKRWKRNLKPLNRRGYAINIP